MSNNGFKIGDLVCVRILSTHPELGLVVGFLEDRSDGAVVLLQEGWAADDPPTRAFIPFHRMELVSPPKESTDEDR
jgi:hypothetical protein